MGFQIMGTDHLCSQPASIIETRIAEVLQQHMLRGWSTYDDPRYPYRCNPKCNVQFRTEREHTEHVAAVMTAELKLTQEWSYIVAMEDDPDHPMNGLRCDPTPFPPRTDRDEQFDTRWVTSWEPAQ